MDIYVLQFDIVHGCQLQCVGCPNSTLLPKISRISIEDFRICLKNIDVKRIHLIRLFSFGEPLLHKNLSKIISVIPEQKWIAEAIEISTNAQHVEWGDFENTIKQQIITRLVVSCDGNGTPEEYERLRPPAKWQRLIEFLERTRELRDRFSPSLQLTTRTIVRTAQDMERWREILIPRGWTPEFRGWMLLPESAQNMTGRELRVPKGPCYFLADPEEFVQHPWTGEVRLLSVDADGTVVPCCTHPRAGVFGNLKRQKFSEILAGKARSAFKKQMKENRASMPICGQCDVGGVGHEGPSFYSSMHVEPE
ncbi:MAG: SPASM domain-containing protein [Burkholderiaceae bacterium]|jgi:radical SAM protein with 4Fe4S-binding SPASM domain|nr:SPASM domain-containing protein [Burkholderiaceae bacterium]